MICKNCGHSFEGNFCNNCGQKANVSRIGFKYFMEEIPTSLFQINHGLFYTIKELATRPGYTIKDFLDGKRKNHFKPLPFIIVSSSLYIISVYWLNLETYSNSYLSGFIEGLHDKTNKLIDVLKWLVSSNTYTSITLIPFFSLASYLSFRKSNYNYFEHIVLNSFIAGFQTVLYLVLGSLLYWNETIQTIPLFLGMIYNIWAYYQFFNDKKPTKRILSIFLTYLIFLILMTFLSIVTVASTV